MNQDDFNELIGVFVAETQEFLQSLEKNLLAIEENHGAEFRAKAVKELFRAAHSIKGSALMFGFNNLAEAAHSLEDCFAILRDKTDVTQLHGETINELLRGVDNLKIITDRVCQGNNEVAAEIAAIESIKSHFDRQYNQPETTASNFGQKTAPPSPVVKAIFERDLPAVFSQLEAELSQVKPETLTEAIAAINKIYYQLSGLSAMLQLPELGQMAEQVRSLIDTPELTVEKLQAGGWAIAQNLQSARDQVLRGEAITVQPLELDRKPEVVSSQLPDLPAETPEIVPPQLKPDLPSPANSPNWQNATIRVDLERLTELVNLVGELVINRTNLELQESQLRAEVKRMRRTITELNHFGIHLREEYDRLSTEEGQSKQVKRKKSLPASLYQGQINREIETLTNTTFDLLELDEYTEFHTTAQSAIEATQTIAQSAMHIEEIAIKFERSSDLMRRITNQLRTRVLQLRVVPFNRAVDHLPRALRELCRTFNKEVNLLLLGRETLIDESLLDALRDPLVHLVRNAFDHGIERPEERLALGKSSSGQIEIEARHQGGQTIITITDDGRGIDPEKIRQRIITGNFMAEEEARELSIIEIYEFLFWPGFSTASEVTNLSGRGVGLDVVRANLRQVRGTVKVDSRLGKGTSFILKLPLLLSITNALMVKVERQTIAVPLDAVEELLNIPAEKVHVAGNQSMLEWRGEFVRLVRLQELLHYSIPDPDGPSPDPLAQDFIPVMVLGAGDGILAVAVERLLGQQEIVVKAVPPPMSKPKGILGSTILGDGRVVMILDIDDLIGEFHTQTSTPISLDDQHIFGAGSAALLRNAGVNSQAQILVVDDSYTIRQLLALTLTRSRYRVVQAKDGQDALVQLEKMGVCNLVIADIEMPRMDGFELVRSLKSQPKFAHIPVAMLTSRSGVKHRQMAMELGAVQYFTKPYNEAQLLAAIAQILHPDPN